MVDADERRKLWHIVLIPTVLDDKDGIFREQASFVKSSECPLPEPLVIRRVAEDEVERTALVLDFSAAQERIARENFGFLIEVAVADVLTEDVCRRGLEKDGRFGAARKRLKTSSTVRPATMEPKML